ncbi:hypothetical protein [Streptomyces sp. SID13031]|uniref:hypothetical protein n=1 Tax=Streptomyces sp. SID13031 TaxID=2706046 RepID=UPI0013CAAE29|nr:hypothetical protein [Streptomyces sp. SID13031]NEA34954.1 hypothetical protein [Streptomyces sp. SID13031]
MNTTTTLRTVLDQWKAGVDAHEPEAVAKVFTDDAIFQGLHPYSIGPAGVAEYYASQPLGMKVDYDILETRQLSDDLALGYLKAAFSFVDRPTLELFLGIIARGNGNDARIAHYQVSKLP